MNKVILLLLATCMLTGCSKTDQRQSDLVNGTHSEMRPQVVVLNYGKNYQYVVRLNGEPIHCASGLSAVNWSAWPLRTGSNELQFTAIALSDTPEEAHFDINRVDTNQSHIGEIETAFEKTNLVNDTLSFSLSRTPLKLKLEEFSTNHVALTKQLTEITSDIVEAYSNGNSEGLGRMLGLDKNSITEGSPAWFWDNSKPTNVVAVGPGDIEILIGERIAVAKPRFEFSQKFHGAGLFSKTEPMGGARSGVDCLVFCQVNKQICLLTSLDNSVPLPIKVDPANHEIGH